jgi:hypothetical protein
VRSLRALALAAAAAAAVTAVASIAPAPASATQKTVLCVAEEAPCQAENISEGGSQIVGESMNLVGNFTYLGVPLQLTCEKTEVDETTVVSEIGNPRLEGSVSYLKFIECAVGKTKCSVGALNMSWRLLLGYKVGGGALTVAKRPEAEFPGFPGTYVECGGFFNCNYYFSDLDEELPEQYVGHFDLIHGGATHQLYVNEARLITATGMCPVKEIFLDAVFSLSQPESLWVSYVE